MHWSDVIDRMGSGRGAGYARPSKLVWDECCEDPMEASDVLGGDDYCQEEDAKHAVRQMLTDIGIKGVAHARMFPHVGAAMEWSTGPAKRLLTDALLLVEPLDGSELAARDKLLRFLRVVHLPSEFTGGRWLTCDLETAIEVQAQRSVSCESEEAAAEADEEREDARDMFATFIMLIAYEDNAATKTNMTEEALSMLCAAPWICGDYNNSLLDASGVSCMRAIVASYLKFHV